MKPYKVKHIPTGLYFQPHKHRGSHLSKNGKIYQTKTNGLSNRSGYKCFRIACQKDSQIHKLTKNILCWSDYTYGQLYTNTNFEDWIQEEI